MFSPPIERRATTAAIGGKCIGNAPQLRLACVACLRDQAVHTFIELGDRVKNAVIVQRGLGRWLAHESRRAGPGKQQHRKHPDDAHTCGM